MERYRRLAKFPEIINQLGIKFVLRILEEVYQNVNTVISVTETNDKVKLYGIRNDLIYLSMIKNEFREPHFQKIARALLDTDSSCIDLGANHGSHSIFMSNICTNGKIYAFEPQPKVFQALTLNVQINKYRNIVLYNLAASEITGSTLYLDKANSSGQYFNSGWSRALPTFSLESSLSVALDDFEFNKITLIKMDIQGSELLAINGMKQLLKRDKPYIFFEVEDIHLKMHKTSSGELISVIAAEGFTIYRIESDYPVDHIAVPNEGVNSFLDLACSFGVNLEPAI